LCRRSRPPGRTRRGRASFAAAREQPLDRRAWTDAVRPYHRATTTASRVCRWLRSMRPAISPRSDRWRPPMTPRAVRSTPSQVRVDTSCERHTNRATDRVIVGTAEACLAVPHRILSLERRNRRHVIIRPDASFWSRPAGTPVGQFRAATRAPEQDRGKSGRSVSMPCRQWLTARTRSSTSFSSRVRQVSRSTFHRRGHRVVACDRRPLVPADDPRVSKRRWVVHRREPESRPHSWVGGCRFADGRLPDTVAVSVSAGVAALIAFVPAINPYRVVIDVVAILLLIGDQSPRRPREAEPPFILRHTSSCSRLRRCS